MQFLHVIHNPYFSTWLPATYANRISSYFTAMETAIAQDGNFLIVATL